MSIAVGRLSMSLWFIAIIVGLSLLALMNQITYPINTDVSWLIFIADHLSVDNKLYVDFYENNPPLIIYIYKCLIYLANFLSWDVIFTIRVTIITFLAINCLVIFFLLSERYKIVESAIKALALLLALLFIPGMEFLQREQIVSIGIINYIVYMLVINRKRSGKISLYYSSYVGFSLSLAMALKPFYLPVVVFLELHRLWVTRNYRSLFRMDIIILVTFGCMYLFLVYIYHPQYYVDVIPLTISTYWGFYQDYTKLLLNLILPLVISSLFLWSSYKTGDIEDRQAIETFSLAVIGCSIAYLIGHIEFSYHLIPIYITVVSLVVWFACSRFSKEKGRRDSFITALFYSLVITGFIGFCNYNNPAIATFKQLQTSMSSPLLLDNKSYAHTLSPLINQIQDNSRSEDYFYLLSNDIFPAFPLVLYTERNWPSKFHSPWPLRGIELYKLGIRADKYDSQMMQETGQWIVNDITDDLIKYRPKVFIVDVSNKDRVEIVNGNVYPLHDLLSYFMKNKQFGLFFQQYQYHSHVETEPYAPGQQRMKYDIYLLNTL